MIYIIDILGVIAFSISGALIAINKKMDLFGILIIAFVTAVGGGTLRDLLIGNTPVTWMLDITYSYVIIASAVAAIILKTKIDYLRTSLLLFDTIGISLYTLVGIQKGIDAGLHPFICIALGTITASFGGVIRDVLCNEIPTIFRAEVYYAAPCILGGITYFILNEFLFQENWVFTISTAVVAITRLVAVKFKISSKVYVKR